MLGLRFTRSRPKTFILSLTVVLILFINYYREDILEAPDRWHTPFFNPEPKSSLRSPTDIFELDQNPSTARHPIDDLVDRSRADFEVLLKKQTFGTAEAAQAYRRRRGRHPPPGFDQWVAFAEAHGCLVIEDHFDQIYHDINPFWALPPKEIRAAAASLPYVISIRNGKASRTSDKWNFLNQYFDMFKKIADLLPDVDIPINEMDEPRVLVPWEDVNEYMSHDGPSTGKDLTRLPSSESYSSLEGYEPSSSEHPSTNMNEYPWISTVPYWNIASAGCSPDMPARGTEIDADFSLAPQFPSTWPNGSYMGYVSNWTIAKDPCVHPHLRNMHGSFVEPISISTSVKLLPIFSGSKLPMNNDVLLPAAIYWSEEERFSAGDVRLPWYKKRNEVVWRGTASGGRNREENWTRFQRHRLLSMLNGTQIQMTLENPDDPHEVPQNFPLPNQNLYPLVSYKVGLLAEWVRSFSNAAFTWLACYPATENYACSYTGSWYRRGRPMPMHRMFLAKYLPDVDGNSFSGRYRAFLKSNSLPIKASIYTEWHDSRLTPWKHYVPMDNTFVDIWAILEYLFRHDEKARTIAEEGRRWADMVLRKEDMLAYVYRLTLEYARVSDVRRNDMGFADDIK